MDGDRTIEMEIVTREGTCVCGGGITFRGDGGGAEAGAGWRGCQARAAGSKRWRSPSTPCVGGRG
jgi:hypothetical protein